MTRSELLAGLITVGSPFGANIYAFRVRQTVDVSHGMAITPDMWIVLFHADGHYEVWSDAAFRRLFKIHGEGDGTMRVTERYITRNIQYKCDSPQAGHRLETEG